MSIERMKQFNRRMARPKFAKGGHVKRKHFDDGGIATNAVSPGVGGPQNLTNANTTGFGGIAQSLGLNAASANIQPGTNTNQLNNAYTGSNNAINAQVGLTNTLTPQAVNGVKAQNAAENQAVGIINGTGPNPAATELAQATGTNVANQAALAAGQRGGAANVGLAERNAGLAGTTAQQGAAGQAATLNAQQQIAAEQTAAQIAAQQEAQAQGATTNLNTAQQNEQNILQNANTSANNAAVGMQSNINNVNSQAAQGVLGAISSGIGSAAGLGGLAEGGEVTTHAKHKMDFVHKMTKTVLDHFADGGSVWDKTKAYITGQPATAEAAPAPSPSPPANVSKDEATSVQNSFRNATSYADGGPIQSNPLVTGAVSAPQIPVASYAQPGSSSGPSIASTPQSNLDLGQNFSDAYDSGHASYLKKGVNGANAGLPQAQQDFSNNLSAGPAVMQDASLAHGGKLWSVHPSMHDKVLATHFQEYFSGGGKVPAMVSPGEVYLNPDQVQQVKRGADPLKVGSRIPGHAKVKGDSYSNDTVKMDLDEGGVVVDRDNVGNKEKATKKVLRSIGPKRHLKRPAKK